MYNIINIQRLLILILTLVLVSTRTNAQKLRVIDNKGTKIIVNNNNVTTNATPPIDPVENDTWFDNTIPTNILTKIYNGTIWVEVPTTNTQTVYVGQFIINNSGTKNIIGLPFEPSQITFVAHANIETLNLNSDNAVGNNNGGINNSFGSMNGFARNDGAPAVPPIAQQVIYVGGSGNSINDISRYASENNCIGLRYGNQNGDNLGVISASVTSFNTNGFTLNVSRSGGATTENVVVLYTAYK